MTEQNKPMNKYNVRIKDNHGVEKLLSVKGSGIQITSNGELLFFEHKEEIIHAMFAPGVWRSVCRVYENKSYNIEEI